MSFGIVEIVTLLLSMAGFGLSPNPSPPSADQALRYAVAEPDLTAHVDAASVVPGNWKLLTQLPGLPQIKGSPELARAVNEAVSQLQAARNGALTATGIDVTADITDATAFVQLVAHGEPRFVAAIRGKFSPASFQRIAKLWHRKLTQLPGGVLLDGGREPALALTKDGVALAGTPSLVRDRLAAGWTPPSHAAGTALGYAADAIAGHPVFALVVTMSAAARTTALAALPEHGLLADVISRHQAAALSIFHDGVGWLWVDRSPAGLDAMELIARGALDVLRAAQIAPRGFAKIAVGALDAYRGSSPQIDELIAHKADILRLVDMYTGSGEFKTTVDKDAKALRLAVRATGKSVSEVLPFGLLVPGAIGAVLLFESGRAVAPPSIDDLDGEPPAPPSGGAPPPPSARPPAGKPPARRP